MSGFTFSPCTRAELESSWMDMKTNRKNSLRGRVFQWLQEPMRLGAGKRIITRSVSRPRTPPEPASKPEISTVPQISATTAVSAVQEETSPTLLMAETDQNYRLPSLADIVEITHRHRCPRCASERFRRSRPRSAEWLLCLVRVVPYRCYSCNQRFFGLALESNPFAERTSPLG